MTNITYPCNVKSLLWYIFFRSMIVQKGFILLVCKSRVESQKSDPLQKYPSGMKIKQGVFLLLAFGPCCQRWSNQHPCTGPLVWPWANIKTVLQKHLKKIHLARQSAGGAHIHLLQPAKYWLLKTFETRPLYLCTLIHPLSLLEVYMWFLDLIIYTVADCLKRLILISSWQTFHEKRGQKNECSKTVLKMDSLVLIITRQGEGKEYIPPSCSQELIPSWRNAASCVLDPTSSL